MGAGDFKHIPLVGNVRRDDPYVHTGLGGVAQGRIQCGVDNQIRRCDINILFRQL